MSVVVPLPQEVTSFLLRPPPETLLVRGWAGTGKTTLALTLLSVFPGQRIYVTSRVTAAELSRDFPWLGSNGGSHIKVVDASTRTGTVRDTARALQDVRNYLVNGETGPASLTPWLPAPLKEAWSLTRPNEPAMVVIDSWDAVVEKYLGVPAPLNEGLPDRAEMERLVLEQLSRRPIHTVLVLEQDAAGQLDYLVNGVLSTGRMTVDERSERWLHIHKLRGMRLDNPSYPFTLEDGKFQCITPLAPDFQPQLQQPEPEPDRRPGFLWPGSSDFAGNFGRLPVGRISLFETESGVPEAAIRLVFAPIVAQVIQGGGRIFHVLAPQVSPHDVWELYQSLIPESTFRRQVRIQSLMSTDESMPAHLASVLLPRPQSGSEVSSHSRTPEALRFLKEGAATGAPNLTIVWVSGLNALGAVTGTPYRAETLPALALEYASGTNAHEIFIGVSGDPLVESVRSMATTRIRFRARSGRVFLYGIQPMTPPFVLVQGDGKRTYQLLRVV